MYSIDATSAKMFNGVSLPTSAALVPTFSFIDGAFNPSALVHESGFV